MGIINYTVLVMQVGTRRDLSKAALALCWYYWPLPLLLFLLLLLALTTTTTTHHSHLQFSEVGKLELRKLSPLTTTPPVCNLDT